MVRRKNAGKIGRLVRLLGKNRSPQCLPEYRVTADHSVAHQRDAIHVRDVFVPRSELTKERGGAANVLPVLDGERERARQALTGHMEPVIITPLPDGRWKLTGALNLATVIGDSVPRGIWDNFGGAAAGSAIVGWGASAISRMSNAIGPVSAVRP